MFFFTLKPSTVKISDSKLYMFCFVFHHTIHNIDVRNIYIYIYTHLFLPNASNPYNVIETAAPTEQPRMKRHWMVSKGKIGDGGACISNVLGRTLSFGW